MNKIINSIALLCLVLANYTSKSQCVAYATNYASACGGSVSVNINTNVNTSSLATAAGINPSTSYWRALFSVTGGTSSGATSSVLGASGNQLFTGSGTFTTSGVKTCSVSIQSSNTYNGSWITRQSFNMNNPPSCVSNILNVDIFTPNTGLNFKINGLAQTTSTPATTYKCNGVDRITMDNLTFGSIVNYNIKVEKGVWISNTFTPSSSQSSALFTATSIPVTDLTTLFNPYLNSYTGYLRVTLTANGQAVCGGTVSKVQIFNILSSATNVDFNMKGNGCSLPNSRYTGPLPIPNATFTASPCIPGWQGVASVGYVGANFVGTIGAIISHNIKVEEVNPTTGISLSTILNINGTGTPSINYDFNNYTTPAGFFFNNYTSLSTSNRTFKVTVTVNTSNCSDQDFSYFRIANGGLFWKTTPSTIEVKCYPNPASDLIKLEWSNESETTSTGLIQISDIYGVRYINKEINENLFLNNQDIDISSLKEGNYIYTISTGNFSAQGQFQKK